MARKPPDFTPEEMEQVEYGKQKVLDSYGSKGENAPAKPAGEPAAPRQIMPLWYSKGGRVKYGSDTRVVCSHKHR